MDPLPVNSPHYAPLAASGVLAPPVGQASWAATPAPQPRRWGMLGWLWSLLGSGCEWLFGLAAMVIGLAIVGAVPVLQFLSLGYLMEVSGRVARSGRFRDGLIGIRPAARVGSMVLGAYLVFLPLRLLADAWHSAQLVNDESPITRRLGGLLGAGCILGLVHVGWACFRGGRLRNFFWPAPLQLVRRLRAGGMYRESRDRVWEFFSSLNLKHYFLLGLSGYFGAFLWLIGPMLLLMLAWKSNHPLGLIPGLVGGILLARALLYLPFLQAHAAMENRFRAMFERRRVGDYFRYAPLAYWFALVVSLALTLPLFLTQVSHHLPAEISPLLNVLCVLLILPGRLFAGWTLGRARHAPAPRFFLFRWLARLGSLPVAAIYVVLIFLAPYVCEAGWKSLVNLNTLLLPIRFLGL